MITLLAEQRAPTADCYAASRIRALQKAYGTSQSFIRFYEETDSGSFLSLEEGFAMAYLTKEAPLMEIGEFLSCTATEVLSEIPLSLPDYQEESGNIFSLPMSCFPSVKEERADVTEDLRAAQGVIMTVFPEIAKKKGTERWYADLSHRVRHKMSSVYTILDQASCCVYCKENGLLVINDLGVVPDYRKKGLASFLLRYAAACHMPFEKMVLLSQNAFSDAFYQHLGFSLSGTWYLYHRNV